MTPLSPRGTDKKHRYLHAPAEKKTSRVPRYQNGRKSSVSAIFCVKPLPWRGHRGLGYRLKPILMKKGLGLMEDLRAPP